MSNQRDLFLRDCAQRLVALVNSSPRTPWPQAIVDEIAKALDAPGIRGNGLSRNDYVKKDHGPDELLDKPTAEEARKLQTKTFRIPDLIPDLFEPQPRADYFHVREKQRKHDEAMEKEAEVEIRKTTPPVTVSFYHTDPAWPGYQLTGFAVERMRRAGFDLKDRCKGGYQANQDAMELVFSKDGKNVSTWFSGLELLQNNDPQRLEALAIARCNEALLSFLAGPGTSDEVL